MGLPCLAHGAGGPLGIDHEWALDQSGLWARKYQLVLEFGAVGAQTAGALWFGDGSRLGHTFWQSIDSSVLSAVAAQALKLAFSRARPTQGDNPDLWFRGRCCESFPSGEVTLQASIVTPFIQSYGRSAPWVWGLEALPLYDAVARLKSRAHWQSDVLAGWVLGTGMGLWTGRFATPLSVRVLPRGLSIGLQRRF